VKFDRYLRRTLGRDNDQTIGAFGRVNTPKTQSIELPPAREATPAPTSKQFYAVIGGLDRLDAPRGGDRR
jgi:hypothetical protein